MVDKSGTSRREVVWEVRSVTSFLWGRNVFLRDEVVD